MVEMPGDVPSDNSGEFIPMYYALDREYDNPETGEVYPFQSYETGLLREGVGDPDHPDYDALADFYINTSGDIEIRIPWLHIQSKDPSKKEFTGNLYEDGFDASVFVDEIFVGAAWMDGDSVIDTFPAMSGDTIQPFESYSWDDWDHPLYEERLKRSYDIIRETFESFE